ncbi:MAG: hypothetical protein FWE93_05155 [Alphaproteobacteria bacterium]|nr:hypothetical protein [Alphaproteobacteria bacterium]
MNEKSSNKNNENPALEKLSEAAKSMEEILGKVSDTDSPLRKDKEVKERLDELNKAYWKTSGGIE